VKIGLAYCPFAELPPRVAMRNAQALEMGGDPTELRHPLLPLIDFCNYYKPAKKGESVIDILTRAEVETAFEEACNQISQLPARALKNSHIEIREIEICDEIFPIHDHGRIKSKVMTSLGFLHLGIKQVPITTKFHQNIQYLFNTKIITPSDAADIIRRSYAMPV
jgi:hypothetical protein